MRLGRTHKQKTKRGNKCLIISGSFRELSFHCRAPVSGICKRDKVGPRTARPKLGESKRNNNGVIHYRESLRQTKVPPRGGKGVPAEGGKMAAGKVERHTRRGYL